MTVYLNMNERDGAYGTYGCPVPPFTAAREPTMTDKDILVFGEYDKSRGVAVVATILFEPEQTLEERKALVEHAIDLCDLVHRARSAP
jgi:hypothetical protein